MNEKQRKEIAKYTTLYLKNRMMINQKLIFMDEDKIDFETFMASYYKYAKILYYIDEHPEEMTKYDDEQYSFGERIMKLQTDFIRRNANFIVMSEELIDELMGYIRESIEKYGLSPKSFYNETFFIREVLSQLVNNIDETKDEVTEEKLERIKMFLAFTSATETVGFCQTIEGHISYDNDKFYISTHNLKPFCKINTDGINEVKNNELEDEDILTIDKMYIGTLTDNENNIYIFLEKIINGQRKMKAITYDQKLYDIFGEKQQSNTIIPFKRAILYGNLNDYFNEMGVSFLVSNLYTKDSFRETIEAFNRFSSMSLAQQKEIEKIVQTATSWWVDQIGETSFDFTIGDIMAILNKAKIEIKEETGLDYDFLKPVRKDNDILRFKEILGNKIRVLLLSRYMLSLKCDYRPEGELAIALKESKLKGTFPHKTTMNITMDKIEVQKGYGAPCEVIYSKDMNNNFKKNN